MVDEILQFFKPNMLYRTFDVQGPGDRLLIYFTLYVHQCLKVCYYSFPERFSGTVHTRAGIDTTVPTCEFGMGPQLPQPSLLLQ